MEKISRKKIVWKKPKRPAGFKKKAGVARSVQESAKDLFFAKYSNTYIPGVKNTTPKEELIILLKIAAEVEHTLLIQYLYAAYTISDNVTVCPLKRSLVFIAVQEMGHLLAVQNLLLSIGGIGNLHLSKNEYRLNGSEMLLPYTLERFSKDLLAKFVAVEAPVVIPPEYLEEVEEIHKLAKNNAGIEFNPVGGLYMKIFWLFQKDDNPDELMKLYPVGELKPGRHISDGDFIPAEEIKKYEADYNTWDLSGGGSVGAHKFNYIECIQRRRCQEACCFYS